MVSRPLRNELGECSPIQTMHISRIDLNLLVVLETIYSEGGITKAADKLNLTQPAISHALARLRELFDDPLFERQGHRMVPTATTKRIMTPLRGTLQSLSSILNETQSFVPLTSEKRFVIGLRDFMEAAVMPSLVRTLEKEAPNVELWSVRASRTAVESELGAGKLDLVIDVLLSLPNTVHFAPFRAERLAVVARKDHPAIRGEISLPTYLAQRHILVTSRRHGPGFEDVELRRLGVQRNVALRCQYYFAACRTVAESDLVLTMPENYARMINAPFGNQVLAMPADHSAMNMYLYWHASAENDPANRWLRSVIQACSAKA